MKKSILAILFCLVIVIPIAVSAIPQVGCPGHDFYTYGPVQIKVGAGTFGPYEWQTLKRCYNCTYNELIARGGEHYVHDSAGTKVVYNARAHEKYTYATCSRCGTIRTLLSVVPY